MKTANGEDEVTPTEAPTGRAQLAEALEKSRAAYALIDAMWVEVKATRGIAETARDAAIRAANAAAESLQIARRSMPPMRAELPSGLDLRAVAEVVKQATLEGERRPDTTPDDQVERAIERIEDRRLGRRVRSVATKVLIAVLGGGWVLDRLIQTLSAHH